MTPLQQDPVPLEAGKKPSHAVQSWAKGVFAGLVVTASLTAIAVTVSPSIWPEASQSDDVGAQSREVRLSRFLALTSLMLEPVEEAQQGAALETMQLDPSAKNALQAELLRPPTADRSEPGANSPSPQPVQALKAQPAKPAPRLAWVTLWDSDVEDGDAVEISSGGYSRTVVLSKVPLTFAVPVPATGTITIKGVRDGEGGGITVGLASGAAKVLLPIMSVDQIIALRVGLPS